jgi:hypothetical protein
MSEDIPQGVQDTDYIVPPTAESLRLENESLLQALTSGDITPFTLWLQRQEMDTADDPVEHAQVLARAAGILDLANNAEGAVTLLLRAEKLIRGRDAETEEQISNQLQKIGGDEAVNALAAQLKEEAGAAGKQELAEVSKQDEGVQLELIELQTYGYKIEPRFGPGEEGKAAYQKRIDDLKALHQKLVNRRAELRK